MRYLLAIITLLVMATATLLACVTILPNVAFSFPNLLAMAVIIFVAKVDIQIT